MKLPPASANRLGSKLSQRLDKHFAACCAAAAGAAYLASPANSQAAVIWSGPQNLSIAPGSVNGGIYIDFENPATAKPGAVPRVDPNTLLPGWDINPYYSGKSVYMGKTTSGVVVSGANAAALAVGTLISSASTFSAPRGSPAFGFAGAVNIAVGQTGYIGFRFDPEGEAGPQTRYGWLQMKVGDNVAGNGTVLGWAYDNTGAGIQVGAVPEPSSIALLAMGVAGLIALRRRQTKA